MNVIVIKLVFCKSVKTHAPGCVVITPIAKLLIIVPSARVLQDTLAIHLPNATQYQVCINITKFNYKTFNLSLPIINLIFFFFFFIEPIVQQIEQEPLNPCIPNPCGSFATCRDQGGYPSCSCLPQYTGTPPNCRPECVISAECPSNKACINEKCRDPCPGSCGVNALCTVNDHTPNCYCPSGYIGDPFNLCALKPQDG